MLPKKNRIPRAFFDPILKEGVFFHSQNLSLRVFKGAGVVSKFSFIVSKKVSKRATTRNLLRRRGYSLLQEILKEKHIENMNPAVLGAFFLKKGAEKLSFSDFRGEIEFLLKKARVL